MARETGVQTQVSSYRRIKKWYFDSSLFNTQHYKARIKGKVEQYKERSCVLPYTLMQSLWKGNFRVTLDYGPQFYYIYMYINIYI